MNNYDISSSLKSKIKKYVITLLCTIPLLIIVGVLLEGRVNAAVRIFIFVVILIVVFISVEIISNKRKTNKQTEATRKDVFK